MAMTEILTTHELTVKRWSTSLAVEAAKKSYFSKFIGKGPDNIIVLKNELHKAAGDKITIGLRMKLSGDGTEGDTPIENTAQEEALSFHNDFVFIDQLRKGTKSKGKMTEQRIPYSLRKEGRDALSTWWAESIDENIMCYLAGDRGIDPSFKTTPHIAGTGAGGWTGRAGNDFQVSDAGHQLYAGDATSKADLDTADIIDLGDIERMLAIAETVDPMMQALNINGNKKFILLMHIFQAFQLRQNTSTNDWIDIHKNTDGADSLIYKNALGEYSGVVLHKHRNVIRFDDYGPLPGDDYPAARALFLGAQAGLMAYGQNSNPQRYSWNEERDDRGNALAITAGTIFGVKKTTYREPTTPLVFKNFGVIALDSYCPSPI